MDEDRATEPGAPTTGLSDDDLVTRAKDFVRRSDNHWSGWREEARTDFEFAAGRQWTDEDNRILLDQERLPITFDQIGALLRAVVGSQINNRQDIRYLPRGMEDRNSAETASLLAEWARGQCEAEDEETAAFNDAATGGMGWVELRLDYDEDPDGKILLEYVDPFQVLPDPTARKANLADSREVGRRKPWRLADIKAQWPEKADELEEIRLDDGGPGLPRWQARGREAYREPMDDAWGDDDRVEVVEYQWAERVPGRMVADPNAGERVFLSEAEWKQLRQNLRAMGLPEPGSIKHYRVEWRRAVLCGSVLLERGDSPCPFSPTLFCITGMRDRNKGRFFGIVRALRDPQRLVNKLLSQTIAIIGQSSKGGWIAEKSALHDPEAFENSVARPGSISVVDDGALVSGRLREKTLPQLPSAHVQLMQFSLAAFQGISGINKELLGLADREQAGVLEAQRKQAAQAILAPLFDSMRRYYKRQGRPLLHFIKAYVPQDKLIRVVGEDMTPRFLRSALLDDAARYDLIVDEAPTSPNAKAETWAALLPLFPTMAKLGMPTEVWMEVLRYSPVAASLVDKIQAAITRAQQEAQAAKQQQPADPEMLKAQAQVAAANAKAQGEMAIKQQKAAAEIELDRAKAAADIQLDRAAAGEKARTEFARMLMKQTPGAIVIQ